MLWFRKKKALIEQQQAIAEITDRQITAHKSARVQAVQEVQHANHDLNKLFVANGFTFKIYLGTGGRAPKTHRGMN